MPGRRPPAEVLPDVRDGLTRVERVVLTALAALSAERGGRAVSTAELYGRVVEQVALSPEAFQAVLRRLAGRGHAPGSTR
jgi:hypothetical protein